MGHRVAQLVEALRYTPKIADSITNKATGCFFIDILPAALGPGVGYSVLQPGSKGGRCVGLTLPPS